MEKVVMLFAYLEYITTIWYILLPFVCPVTIWYIFPRFGILCPEKIWHPWSICSIQVTFEAKTKFHSNKVPGARRPRRWLVSTYTR
jgi:hypothetical protein